MTEVWIKVLCGELIVPSAEIVAHADHTPPGALVRVLNVVVDAPGVVTANSSLPLLMFTTLDMSLSADCHVKLDPPVATRLPLKGTKQVVHSSTVNGSPVLNAAWCSAKVLVRLEMRRSSIMPLAWKPPP
ncbi:MAG: hypothetical protein DDT21_02718 [Syntrophomonadaceae bacterium]|nr:hypothetical protein [Bacillota bacterium]